MTSSPSTKTSETAPAARTSSGATDEGRDPRSGGLRRSLVWAVACSLLVASGCATTAIQVGYWKEDPRGPFGKPIYVFGGTIADAGAVVGSTSATGEGTIGALLIFDLPFSLAADVVLLPLCIYQQVDRSTWKEEDFLPRLDDPDPEVRRRAADALGGLGGTSHATVEALTKALGDADAHVRSTAASSLGELGTQSASAAPALVERLKDPDSNTRARAASTLGEIGAEPSLVVPALIEALHDPDVVVRCQAANALAETGHGSEPALAALERMLDDPYEAVREAARAALAKAR
jgi:hypothetical protein